MIIVIEGPDNAGKTTLAFYLARYLKCAYAKSELRPVPDNATVFRYHAWLQMAQAYSKHVVSDRHHVISEPIYGTVIRGRHSIDQQTVHECCRDMLLIYCRPPIEKIQNSIHDRDQMAGVADNLESIVRAYDRSILSTPVWDRLQYDYTTQSIDEITRSVAKRIKR